ncbi:Aluminum-activated malate transporter like [Actinidia chinensis var. chinensis]|uniref:Aluminum-activated malate transporter like n=1 Tax=Actinidia chinensis var. chinensis TaxID=1590841 RepID=A0A2R6P725_ACTCC|nr:Aluminum-activated malate transporter like [Actinidia chinensis var. chinensis]
MEMEQMVSASSHAEAGPFTRAWHWLKALPEKLWSKFVSVATKAKKLGQDDPRRIVHSLKVGLAITLVSLFYYFEPLYDGLGVSAMWAVLTVVVVFEFSVGATLGRGVNRGLATLLAGALGFGAHRLASFSGNICEPILLGLFVFLLAAVVTYIRFFPRMKARYDYGLLIFILTFCLISVSGYRDDEVLDMAQKRLSTILIGGATALFVCVFLCPVWAGDDLHNLAAINMEKLGSFLEGFGNEYFKTPSQGQSMEDKEILQGYRSVLNSKTTEESLANFAKWEPRHGRFRYRHPWQQYLRIGSLTRQCAYRIEALNGYLSSELKASQEIRSKIEDPCTKMSKDCSCALKELAQAVKTMTKPSTANCHIANSKIAAKSLKSMLKTGLWQDTDLLEIVPAATVASLLIDIVSSTEEIAESVNELASLANFRSVDDTGVAKGESKLSCSSSIKGPHHIITIHASTQSE